MRTSLVRSVMIRTALVGSDRFRTDLMRSRLWIARLGFIGLVRLSHRRTMDVAHLTTALLSVLGMGRLIVAGLIVSRRAISTIVIHGMTAGRMVLNVSRRTAHVAVSATTATEILSASAGVMSPASSAATMMSSGHRDTRSGHGCQN